MSRIISLIFFCISLAGSLYAQDTDSAGAYYPPVHQLSADRVEKIRNDSDFDYMLPENKDKVQTEEQSLWDIIMIWLAMVLGKAAIALFSGGVISYIFGTITILLLIYFASRLMGFDPFMIYRGGKKASGLAYTIEDENIHEIDFAKEIEEAMSQGQFRKVVRLIYLHMLKELSDKEKINWRPNKTNADYLYEMRLDPLSRHFETLNYFFVYSWYGDFDVNLAQVEKVRSVFDEMKTALLKG